MSTLEINYIPSEIKVVAVNNPEMQLEGWLTSRPKLTREEVNVLDVMKLDVPVNELVSLTLEVTCPIILREVFTVLRDHSLWARTSRVDNITEGFTVHESQRENEEHFLKVASDIQSLSKLDVHQDSFRLHLPLVAMTGFTTTLNFRTLIKVVKFLNSLKSELAFDLGEKLVDALCTVYDREVIAQVIQSYNYADYAPLTKVKEPSFDGNAHFITVGTKIKFSLYAQLIRHRTLNVLSNLRELIEHDNIHKLDQNSEIEVVINASKPVWDSIIKKRLCWIAHAELWLPLTTLFGVQGKESLPCASGSCPFKVDAEARYSDKDPGVPCPIYSNLYDKPKAEYVDAMLKEVEDGGRPHFWKFEINR